MSSTPNDPETPHPETPQASKPPKKRITFLIRAIIVVVVLIGVGLLFWNIAGKQLYQDLQEYRDELSASEDSAPVGYIGLHYRKSYNNRAPRFLYEEEGRSLLWASTGDGETPEFYDVTDAEFDPTILQGGFGHDSIPGIDFPIIEDPDGSVAQNIPDGREVAGIAVDGQARAYPVEMLTKVEVANDALGDRPYVIHYGRGPDSVAFYTRDLDGQILTFGTTGYGTDEKVPLLYDRATKSLWLPSEDGDSLICVSGELVGQALGRFAQHERMSWRQWRRDHPDTTVVVGNDRDQAIPEQ